MEFIGVIFLIIIILGFVGFIFINIKINSLRYRAKQHILKNSGLSSSDISSGITSSFEKKHIQNFLVEHPNFTEESIKKLLKQYTVQIFNKNSINEFSQAVSEKMQKDSKLDRMQTMEYRRTNITHYGNSKMNAVVVYTDNKDEYNIYLNCSILGDNIKLESYQISKGAVVGF